MPPAPPSSPPAAAPAVAVVTCKVLPEPDPDQELLLAALRRAGLRAELLPWDDAAAAGAGAFDLCVLRSTWNYPHAAERFLAWCEEAAARSRLVNPYPAVRWNLHKRYLRDLAADGVPVVPTAWFDRAEAPGSEAPGSAGTSQAAGTSGDSAGTSEPGSGLAAVVAERGWGDIVVKPAVSASSYRTRRFAADELGAAERFLADLLAERDAMVQPYMSAVETSGERSLVWIDGELTHAVRKNPRFSGGDEAVSEAVPISTSERALAERTLAAVRRRLDGDLLYARVDMVAGAYGQPVIAELELIEPSLFLLQHPPALERLVAGIARRVR